MLAQSTQSPTEHAANQRPAPESQAPERQPAPDSSATVEETPAEGFDTGSTCVECGAATFTRSEVGEWYCTECGVVQTRTAVERTEPGWTPRGQRRAGPASSIAKVNIGTRVGNAGEQTPLWAQYNDRLNHETETLRHGLRELRALATALEATEALIEQAAYLFRRVAEDGHLVGHSLEAMAAACVHVTAREHHVPFPLEQFAEASPVPLADIKSAVSRLLREYDLQVLPPLPTAFIGRFSSEAGLSQGVRNCAERLAEALVEDEAHIGQSPTGLAAAALYGAAKARGVEVTQDELSDVAYVSVVTLSRHWQTVQTHLDKIED